jgi:glycosyltransferase involved in cell wall biosynthesis
MEPSPHYSVVITAHNEVASIGACLASIAAQRGIAPSEIEIILIDDRSTDGTAAEAEASNVPALRIMRIDRLADTEMTARQYALDRGFCAARGEIILTLDADGVVQDDWIVRMAGPILAGRADAVAGPVHYRATNGSLAPLQTTDTCFYLTACRLIAQMCFAGGALFGNFAFRTPLYAATGGFGRIGFSLTEDFAFARAVFSAGHRIFYVTDNGVCVRACRDWRSFADRAKRVSAGGLSALSVALTVWLGLFPFFAVAAVISSSPILTACFLLRYVAGAVFVATALVRYRQSRLVAWALVYEPVMTIFGLTVILRMRKDRGVEWGGLRYGRWSKT